MEFVVASHNRKKIGEMDAILGALGISFLPLPQGAPEPEEDGAAFEENALIKARAACAFTGKPAVADDSGLCVDALGGAPGIYSARYCEGSDSDRNAFLLEKLAAVPDGGRQAQFVSAVACVFPSGEALVVRGECAGEIVRSPQGEGGFGYDPLFYVAEYGCTFAQLPAEVKNRISHRARALQKMKQALGEYYAEQ
ncbi:RdgB/HAM1 family non-canonical purine NTP pyrophosphatase [Clostridiaceae bacterium]|nr:RdgB/HAM1 family non-canonical purine NTP pyrophosphatase [Clostridiaceae bacterium]